MSGQHEKAARFLSRHRPGEPLLMPNAWDAGSARVLASLGFEAIATTSSGYAATLGRLDYNLSREEAIAHAAALVEAVPDVPVSADLENCFADDAAGVARTVELAIEAGLAGCSIEDYSGSGDEPIYPLPVATERVAAAAEVAHRGSVHLVLTARAENHLHGVDDLGDTIARLTAFADAGADVVYAPGLRSADQLRAVVESVGVPVNGLVGRGVPPVAELASIGLARLSVGGAFAFAALGTLAEAASELRDRGTYGYADRVAFGARAARDAFDDR